MADEIKFAHIYVMAYDRAGPVKVGRAFDPEARRRELQTGSHRSLKIFMRAMCGPPTMAELEGLAHLVLQKSRISGEWFNVPVETAVLAVWCAFEAFQFGAQDIIGRLARQTGLDWQVDLSHLPNDMGKYRAKQSVIEARVDAAEEPLDLVTL